jgi:hypothetical protein
VRVLLCATPVVTWDLQFFRSYQKDLWFLLLNAALLMKKQYHYLFYVLGLMWQEWVGLKLTTSRMLIESATTRLSQPVARTEKLWIQYLCINCHNKERPLNHYWLRVVLISTFIYFKNNFCMFKISAFSYFMLSSSTIARKVKLV